MKDEPSGSSSPVDFDDPDTGLRDEMVAEAALFASREEIRRSEATYRALFDNMLNGSAYCRMLFEGDRPVDWIYLSVNRAFEEQTRLVGVAGRLVSEVIPGIRESSPDLFEIYGRVARTGRPERLESWVEALQEWFSVSVYSPAPEHFVAVFDIVTARKEAEKVIRDAQEQLERLVEERTTELRSAIAYNRSLFEASLDPLMTIGRDGRILDVNEATVRVTGFPRERLVGSEFRDFVSDPEKARAGYAHVFREGAVRNYELEIRNRDGSLTPVECNATVFRDGSGPVLGAFAAARDISARKKFEAELGEANRELEAFSYSVSHELRSPLRAIDGFTALLAQSYGGRLDEDGRRLLGRVRWNAQRMGHLIDDLLTFARTGRTDLAFEQVDMNEAARSAFAQAVPDPAARSRISFSASGLPGARGDAALLRRVWENLLQNAVKFSARKEAPEIRVEGTARDGEAIYRVRDNGIGFDMRYADKLFGVFHRLHGVTEFEGSGVGLALVRRIVVRHGGRVWAEGEPDRGATLSFSLPLKNGPQTKRVAP